MKTIKKTNKPSQCDIAQRIYDLRKRGHRIVDDYVVVTNEFGEKYRVKQYRLVK